MAEAEQGPITPETQEMVELIVVRGTRCGDKDVKRGEKIQVPSHFKKDGVYPVRWWVANKKAARNDAEFKAFVEHVGDSGGPQKAAATKK